MFQRLLILSIFAALVPLAAAPTVTVAPVDPALTGISIRASGSPEFAAAFASMEPDANRAAFAPILPYSIVIRNAGPKALVGLCVRFEIATDNRRPFKMVLIPGQIPPLEKPVLGIGDQVFMSPENDFNQAARKGVEPRGHTSAPLDFYARARNISIAVDSVLYADGGFAGPDKEGMFDKWTAQLSAEEQGAKAVLGYRGQAVAELEDYLAKTGIVDHFPASSAEREAYNGRLAQQARAWQRLLKNHGADAVFETAETSARDAGAFKITRKALDR